mmetsp:Transcript_22143/g.32155  ORF Transcript_22143/g.32155 Transcript_22143/m.32155 type:complete len:156 (-) Transcript_22143:212-679(-)
MGRMGTTKESPVLFTMKKPFHIQACCFCRPELIVSDAVGTHLGTVKDPCACCRMDQRILDAQGQLKYGVVGSICQIGLCCPCCGDVVFHIKDHNGGEVGDIRKVFGGLGELCLGVNRFKLNYPPNASELDHYLLFSSAMLIDLEYFEKNKNNNTG